MTSNIFIIFLYSIANLRYYKFFRLISLKVVTISSFLVQICSFLTFSDHMYKKSFLNVIVTFIYLRLYPIRFQRKAATNIINKLLVKKISYIGFNINLSNWSNITCYTVKETLRIWIKKKHKKNYIFYLLFSITVFVCKYLL